MTGRFSRTLGILSLAAGIVLVMFEFDSYRRVGQVSYFWLFIAVMLGVLGVLNIFARPR